MTIGMALVGHRGSVICLVLLGAAAFGWGLSSLQVGFKVDGFFETSDPQLQRAMDHYGGNGYEPPDRLLLFAWPESVPLSDATLARLRDFEDVCREHAVAEHVVTLASARVPGRLAQDPQAVAKSSTFRDLLVSKGNDAVGGMIALRRGWLPQELQALCDALRTEVASLGRQLHLCGLPYHTMVSRQLVRSDMARFLPIGTAVSAVLLFWLVPHWLLALLALTIVPLTLVSTLGLMGYMGIDISMLTSTLPTLLLCMSVADGLHMVGRYIEEREVDGDAKLAAARTFAAMFMPCLLTSLTTIVGFASLQRAALVDLRYLGVFAAVGMAFAFLYTVLLLPALMSFVSSPCGRRVADPAGWIVRSAARLQSLRPWWWVAAATVLVIASGLQAAKLQTDHRITEDLWPDSEVMRSITFFEERFVGIMPAEILVESDGDFGAPERAELAEFVLRVEADPDVTRTLSVADLYSDGVSPLMLRALLATKLLPSGVLGNGGDQVRVLAFRSDLGTRAWQRFTTAMDSYATGLTRIKVRLAGMQMVGTAQVVGMTTDLRNSFLGSIFVIFTLVWMQCRRFKLAVVAMYACLVPMVSVLGLMAYLDLTMRPLTVISFCVALGLMIDDTIHLTARWREERAAGVGSDLAVRRALATAGRPVVTTTLVLLVGFVTILTSEFRGTHTFGLLVDVSLLGALLSALVLLPALLRMIGNEQPSVAPRPRP